MNKSARKFITLSLLFVCTQIFAITLNDNGKISPTDISQVIHVKTEADIVNAVNEANKKNIPIALMGKQHSQGGQSLAKGAIALDMLSYNKVLNINLEKKQVTVEPGITWSDLQKFINPYNLAIKSMQSPNIFTVGGSVSVNAHGDDFRAGAVGNSVVDFHLLLANGEKILVSPKEHTDLWNAVRGGYGLLGVITDVTLQLTDNTLLTSHYHPMKVNNLPTYFKEKIFNDKNTIFFYAHLNITPGEKFLKDMYVITYTDTHKLPKKIISLDNPDKWNAILTPMFNTSRHGDFGKSFRWDMEKFIFKKTYSNHTVTRNNAMEKPVSFASNHNSAKDADWLQEYFIPLDNMPAFIESLRAVVTANKINLLNVTIRYVPAERDILLSYANTNRFAVVLYFNQKLNQKDLARAQVWTKILIDSALALNGHYYLPYQGFATEDQFRKAYPGYKTMMVLKQKYDENNRFTNRMYETYFHGV